MKKALILAGAAFGLLFPVLLQGQEIGLLRLNPERPAFQGHTAVWGGIEEGGYRPSYAASFQWMAGADAHGVRHGKSTSWTGTLSFEQMMGFNMKSSMFLEPGYFPMDILESTAGTKSRQTCLLEGGFLTDLGYELAVGMRASFKAAHVAKQQEIPHSSFGMDAQVEPTVTYVMDDDMGLVSSYLVRFRTENVKANPSGDNLVFLDKGMRYGVYEDGFGAFPVRELSHGFNELLYNPELSLGFGIVWKRGQAGENGYNRFRFPGSTMKGFIEQAFLAEALDHVYRISYQRQRDQLREATAEGYQSFSDRVGRTLDLKYEARFLRGILKSVAVDFGGDHWIERTMLSSPVGDKIKWFDGAATLLTSLSYGAIDLDLNVMAGRGWWQERGRGVNPEDAGNLPSRQTEDWLQNMDYRLVPRTGMGGTLTGRIPAVEGLYVQLYAYWYHALGETSLPGNNREIATLKVGYKF